MFRVGGVAAVIATSLLVPAAADAAPGATDAEWDHVAHCESGGDWHLNTGNGYYGGLQLSASTWRSFGGRRYAARADLAGRAEQIDVGNRIYAAEGWGPWPTCAPHEGTGRTNHRHGS